MPSTLIEVIGGVRNLDCTAISHTTLFKTYVPRTPPSSAPVATYNSSQAGSLDAGTHSYVLTFVATGNETAVGPISNIITATDGSHSADVTLRIGPIGTTGRRLYRTVAGNTGTYKLVAAIDENTSATFNDGIADASLTDNPPVEMRWRTNHVLFEVASVTGYISNPYVTVGSNAPNYDNIVNSTTSPLNAPYTLVDILATSSSNQTIPSSTDVLAFVQTPASATTFTLNIWVLGQYYVH